MPIKRDRAGTLCIEANRLLLVRLQEPQTKTIYLFPPGGAIEPGESPEQAAIRETYEETGYRVATDPVVGKLVQYPFHWAGLDYDCSTFFFRARLISHEPDVVTDPIHSLGHLWMKLDEVNAAFAFNPFLQEGILSCLRSI